KAENHTLEIGSGQFIPGFEEEVAGKEAGETEVVVTFPEEYQVAELAGKEAIFKVNIHEIKEKEVPELDDVFAKDLDEEEESLDEMKTKKKDEILKQKELDIDNQKR